MDYRKALAVVTSLSAVIGTEILLVDSDLWEAAPSHAYGLIGFVGIDLAILGFLLSKKHTAFRIAMIWGLIQTGLMLGDILTAQSSGYNTYGEFVNYLLSLWNWDLLLILQPITVALGFFGGNRQRSMTEKTVR